MSFNTKEMTPLDAITLMHQMADTEILSRALTEIGLRKAPWYSRPFSRVRVWAARRRRIKAEVRRLTARFADIERDRGLLASAARVPTAKVNAPTLN